MSKVLIVEDELAYLNLLQSELEKWGHQVITAKNGDQGLKVAQKEKPDLILLDIRMPVMNGMEMLEELRKTEYGSSAKVVILTNLEPDSEIIPKVVKGQPTYYLMKSDLSLDDLKVKLKEALE